MTTPDPRATAAAPSSGGAVVGRLSTLDRFLPVWIIAAMAAGLLLGRSVDGLANALDAVQVALVYVSLAARRRLFPASAACGVP